MSIAVLVVLVGLCPPAFADEVEAQDPSPVAVAERRAGEAFQAYTRKEYRAAIALYVEAYEAAPNGSILFNIARIYDLKLRNPQLAITFYRRYVADPGAQIEHLETANQRLRSLRGAEAVYQATQGGSLEGGSLAQRADAGAPPPMEAGISRERQSGWSTLRWAGAALGVAGLTGVGVGSAFGMAAMSHADTAKSLCDGNACSSQRGVDAAKTASTDATFSNVGFAVGGALLVAGVSLFLLGGDRAPEAPAVHLRAQASSSATSLQVVGSW
ncbi:MAG TPA: hypothetical protein VFH68_03650 [Polyangia bacterium]|nr:hypothetical protein [Polyangia bacterium]